MQLSRIQIIEIALAIIAILSGLILIGGHPNYSYILLVSSTLLSGLWLVKSLSKSQFGAIPWYAIIFILPMIIIPIGLALKLSIIEGGAFILFIGITLSLLAIAALFVLVITSKAHLKYLKNVSFRLVPASVLGIIVYFTPQMQIIELVYARNAEKVEFFKNQLLYPYEAKEKKRTIAFVSNRDGNSDILEIQPDGSRIKTLIDGPSNQWSPRATKDGLFLYYLDDRDSITAIYKYDLRKDSSQFVKEVVFDDFYFHLHPTENKIISHDTSDGFFQLFIHDFDSNTVRQISFDSSNSKKPLFMNDGHRIIFQSDRNGNDDLFIMDLKNDSLINLTNSEANERNPSISPYDDVVVFNSDIDKPRINLFYMIIETREVGQLSDSPGMELMANFSPDAKNLVFGSNRDDNWEIYLMTNEGEFKDRLTNHPAFDGDAIYIERSYLKK